MFLSCPPVSEMLAMACVGDYEITNKILQTNFHVVCQK